MCDRFVGVVVSVPDEYFPDDDDICLTAGKFVCTGLEAHLGRHGHTIPDWVKGGCDEDWGVYFESHRGDDVFEYHICFFPDSSNEIQCQMIVQYRLKQPFLRSLFKKPKQLDAGDVMHDIMREFGQVFTSSRILTQSEFENQF